MELKTWIPTLKSFTFPGGHEVAPPPVIPDAMRWLKAATVPGKRHTAELDRDNGAGKYGQDAATRRQVSQVQAPGIKPIGQNPTIC
jgi:hypothetical protein